LRRRCWPLDLSRVIVRLCVEREDLDRAIRSLEAFASPKPKRRVRPRKWPADIGYVKTARRSKFVGGEAASRMTASA